MISLLEEKWIPVLRANGRPDWIAPHQIGEPDIMGFAASRADFNGALAQWLVGLLQTAWPEASEAKWRKYFKSPPQPGELGEWFEPLTAAFVLDGDGARFMQDLGLNDGAECGVDALLIDAAGGSAVEKNTDHFVKRGTVNAICPHCAALALFTLQTNAPAGGAGHRTSLRGGGPLTTLVVASPGQSLWHDLWLNVVPQQVFLAGSGDAAKTMPWSTFPWLAAIDKIQATAAGAETQPVQVHPHHVFWAMPRRIRLDFDDVRDGVCDLCKRASAQLVQRYVTKPQGLNYSGPWRHPLSPYYKAKEDWLPVHPQPGGFSYRHWLAWVMGSTGRKKEIQTAAVVNYVVSEERQLDRAVRLWVFGYDMDNMKARCWYETTFPVYSLVGLNGTQQSEFHSLVTNMVEAAEQAAFYLRQAVKQAWFGDSDVRGDLSFVDKMFWDGTEIAFYRQLKTLIEQTRREGGVGRIDGGFAQAQATSWHQALSGTVLRLFDADLVGAGSIAQQDPRRVALAHLGLKRNLAGKALKTILGLPLPVGSVKAVKGKATVTSEAPSL